MRDARHCLGGLGLSSCIVWGKTGGVEGLGCPPPACCLPTAGKLRHGVRIMPLLWNKSELGGDPKCFSFPLVLFLPQPRFELDTGQGDPALRGEQALVAPRGILGILGCPQFPTGGRRSRVIARDVLCPALAPAPHMCWDSKLHAEAATCPRTSH